MTTADVRFYVCVAGFVALFIAYQVTGALSALIISMAMLINMNVVLVEVQIKRYLAGRDVP